MIIKNRFTEFQDPNAFESFDLDKSEDEIEENWSGDNGKDESRDVANDSRGAGNDVEFHRVRRTSTSGSQVSMQIGSRNGCPGWQECRGSQRRSESMREDSELEQISSGSMSYPEEHSPRGTKMSHANCTRGCLQDYCNLN